MAKKFNLSDFAQPIVKMSDSDKPEITMLPIADIRANANNFYDTGTYIDLAESIKVNGLIQPITVFQDGDRYVILSGHRRFKAVRYLYDGGDREKWETVPCIIAAAPQSAAHEKLILCHANSTSRVLSGWEIAQQSRIIRESLVTIAKEQGMELPERMRAVVAEELKISESKLARLEAIDKRLTVPEFVDGFKHGRLPEEAAYQLSQLPASQQEAARDWMQTNDIEPERASIKQVSDAKQAVAEELRQKVTSFTGVVPVKQSDYDPIAEAKEDRKVVGLVMDDLMFGITFSLIFTRNDGAEALKRRRGGYFQGFSRGEYFISFSPKGLGYNKAGKTPRIMSWLNVWDCMGDVARVFMHAAKAEENEDADE